MAVSVREDALAQSQARPAIDVTKIVLWVLAAALPWAAIIVAAKVVIGALA
jgi:hypothetical protein